MRYLRSVSVIGVALLAVTACSSGGAASPTPTPPSAHGYAIDGDAAAVEQHTVEFEVTGTAGSAHVDWATPGGQSQADASLPWQRTEQLSDPMDTLILALDAVADHGGTLGCRLIIDNMIVDEQHASGDVPVVRCKRLP